MRASRLVQMLPLLQTNGKMTGARLAEELEVSVRTIYRDIEALSGAGVPTYAEAGPGGGVRLVEGYRTRLTGLTAEEAPLRAHPVAADVPGQPSARGEGARGRVRAARRLRPRQLLRLGGDCEVLEPPDLRAHLATRASQMVERYASVPA